MKITTEIILGYEVPKITPYSQISKRWFEEIITAGLPSKSKDLARVANYGYKKLAIIYHADKKPENAQCFHLLNGAKEILINMNNDDMSELEIKIMEFKTLLNDSTGYKKCMPSIPPQSNNINSAYNNAFNNAFNNNNAYNTNNNAYYTNDYNNTNNKAYGTKNANNMNNTNNTNTNTKNTMNEKNIFIKTKNIYIPTLVDNTECSQLFLEIIREGEFLDTNNLKSPLSFSGRNLSVLDIIERGHKRLSNINPYYSCKACKDILDCAKNVLIKYNTTNVENKRNFKSTVDKYINACKNYSKTCRTCRVQNMQNMY